MIVSDCCGATANGLEDYGICSDCKEHCEFFDDEVEFTPCDECDRPDACCDFCQCAIEEGIKKNINKQP